MKAIVIREVPPGFAPLRIKEAWIGCKIPLATEQNLLDDPPSEIRIGSDNLDGYYVLRSKAIEALRQKGADEAVAFWDALPFYCSYLVFKKEVCTLV